MTTRQSHPRAPTFEIEVTQQAIDAAVKSNSGRCMIATAIRDKFPDAIKPLVDLRTIRFSLPKKGLRYTYLTPEVAAVFLWQWDDGVKVSPFKFRLRNGLVTSMRKRPSGAVGQTLAKPKLAKAKVVAATKTTRAVGGRPPPTLPGSRAQHRIHGLRNFQRYSGGSINRRRARSSAGPTSAAGSCRRTLPHGHPAATP